MNWLPARAHSRPRERCGSLPWRALRAVSTPRLCAEILLPCWKGCQAAWCSKPLSRLGGYVHDVAPGFS